MNENAGRQTAWTRRHLEGGATVVIALHWDEVSKQWRMIASHHGENRVRVYSTRIHTSAGIDVADLERIATAIRRECESWLF